MNTYRGLLGIKTGAEDSGTAFLGKRGNVLAYLRTWFAEHKTVFDDTAILMNWAYQYNRVVFNVLIKLFQIRTSED